MRFDGNWHPVLGPEITAGFDEISSLRRNALRDPLFEDLRVDLALPGG